MMKDRTLRVLEFSKIRDQLAALALTPMGAEICAALIPGDDMRQIERAQQETEEATIVLNYTGANPLVPFDDVREPLALSEKGATLSPKALLNIASCLRAARAARQALCTDRANTPLLSELASGVCTQPRIEQAISDAIVSEDEIADKASPALADIRRHIRIANDRVREKLSAMTRSTAYAKYLQDPIVTIRNDRYVLPVRQEYRGNVPGLVHDQSASGATLFIEPLAVVELGNELKQLAVQEKQEIERILAELSALIAPDAPLIARSIGILARLDFIFAKGRLAMDMRAVQPRLNTRGFIKLTRARHPLIDPEKVVPLNLWMGEEFTTLVITGPNTGGKTVTLKTVGLLTLMAQAGLQVPADLGTEMAVFKQVYADIGDEQSIEQSLSTFSAHMTNIVDIVGHVTPDDLALFDELGAGTDPTEGAALAQSILTFLRTMRARALATTHYAELKTYALTTEGVENASVEFDVATLRPTYRLSIGVPGKSNAFEISRKLGLPESLIRQAKELLSTDTVRFEDVIKSAEYHRQVAERERKLAEEARAETVRMRDEAEALRRDMEEKMQSATRKGKDEAKRILENARREAESIVSDLRRMKKEGQTPEHEAQRLMRQLENGVDALSEGLAKPTVNVSQPPKSLKPGTLVDVVHLKTRATVLTEPDAKGEVTLQAGIMKIKSHISQLRVVDEPKPKQQSTVRAQTGTAERTVHMECDVRGMSLEEALEETDRYLDEAVMASLGEVSIIHGKGTGVLRQGITQHLRRHPHVKSYRLGVYGEGESGVTVVTLQ